MNTHSLKIATACGYGLFMPPAAPVIEGASGPHNGLADQFAATVGKLATQVADAVKPAMDAITVTCQNFIVNQSAGAGGSFPAADAVLWASGAGIVLLAAMWLGRTNLAPLH